MGKGTVSESMLDTKRYSSRAKYRIKIKGILDPKWQAWFDGFEIITQDGSVTLLQGTVRDQAALHGFLNKIARLGLPLLLVEFVMIDESTREKEKAHASS